MGGGGGEGWSVVGRGVASAKALRLEVPGVLRSSKKASVAEQSEQGGGDGERQAREGRRAHHAGPCRPRKDVSLCSECTGRQ